MILCQKLHNNKDVIMRSQNYSKSTQIATPRLNRFLRLVETMHASLAVHLFSV